MKNHLKTVCFIGFLLFAFLAFVAFHKNEKVIEEYNKVDDVKVEVAPVDEWCLQHDCKG